MGFMGFSSFGSFSTFFEAFESMSHYFSMVFAWFWMGLESFLKGVFRFAAVRAAGEREATEAAGALHGRRGLLGKPNLDLEAMRDALCWMNHRGFAL